MAGVNPRRWPVDFASLARYGRALTALHPDDGGPAPRLSLDGLLDLAAVIEQPAGVGWQRLA